jgi:hypothetical protein
MGKALGVACGNGAAAQGLQSASHCIAKWRRWQVRWGGSSVSCKTRKIGSTRHCVIAISAYELRRQRQLLEARNRLLAELDALNAAVALADVE